MYASICTILHRELEHLQSLVSTEGLETNLPWIPRDECYKAFRESEVTHGFTTVWGLVPIIPVLFKIQLYVFNLYLWNSFQITQNFTAIG